jgi:HPr kinase/phosphorylase
MNNELTTRDFIQKYGESLGLHWQAGHQGADRLLQNDKLTRGTALVGYLNLVRPNLIQVLGAEEVNYLTQLGKNSRKDAISCLFDNQPAMIIFSNIKNSNKIVIEFLDFANQKGCPLLTTELNSENLIERIQYRLTRLLGDSKIIHGVFMEVMGIGVLLTGASGIGKSELALELLSRGHRLIADDAPEFRRSSPESIRGRCPLLLKDFLEVRGLGILNVRAMFGDSAIVETKRLRLIVHLTNISEKTSWDIDRIGGSKRKQNILEVDVPKVNIPVAPGRNVAVIIEAAVRNHVLFLNGYSASEDFMQRQQKIMESD